MIRPTTSNGCCMDDASSVEPATLRQLVHPQFFAGQLLTDRDLKDLLAYVKDRFALLRYRDGWGVACGMMVKPNANGKKPLTVTAGYAVDCAGRELILECDEEICLPPPERQQLPCPPISNTNGEEAEQVNFPGPGTIPEDRLGLFDITGCYVFEDFDPAIVLSDCKRKCKDSRRKEKVKIVAACVDPKTPSAFPDTDHTASTKDILMLLESLKKLLHENGHDHFYTTDLSQAVSSPVSKAAETIKKWIAEQLQSNPRFTEVYPGLQEWWEKSQKPKPYNTPWKVAAFLSWLIDALRHPDWDCPDLCAESMCVPLARVWAEWSEGRWQIRYIDRTPPSRKVFDPCCREKPLLVSHYFRRHWWDVRRELEAHGIETYLEWEEPHLDPAALERKFHEDSSLDRLTPGQPVVAVVTRGTTDDPNAGRVIRFRKFNEAEKPLFEGPDKLRMPITKPGAGFTVAFHEPKGDVPATPVFAAPEGNVIPKNQLRPDRVVDVAITLNSHFDAREVNDGGGDVRQWKVFVYDELDFDPDNDAENQTARRIRMLRDSGPYQPGATIAWRVLISRKLLDKQMLEYAVMLQENFNGEARHAAVWEHVPVVISNGVGMPETGANAQEAAEAGEAES